MFKIHLLLFSTSLAHFGVFAAAPVPPAQQRFYDAVDFAYKDMDKERQAARDSRPNVYDEEINEAMDDKYKKRYQMAAEMFADKDPKAAENAYINDDDRSVRRYVNAAIVARDLAAVQFARNEQIYTREEDQEDADQHVKAYKASRVEAFKEYSAEKDRLEGLIAEAKLKVENEEIKLSRQRENVRSAHSAGVGSAVFQEEIRSIIGDIAMFNDEIRKHEESHTKVKINYYISCRAAARTLVENDLDGAKAFAESMGGRDAILSKFLEDFEKWAQFEAELVAYEAHVAETRANLVAERARLAAARAAPVDSNRPELATADRAVSSSTTSSGSQVQTSSDSVAAAAQGRVDDPSRPVPPRPADDPLSSPTVPTTVKTSDLKSLSELKSEHEAEINETKKQNDKKVLVLSLGLGVGLTAAFAAVVVVLVKMNYVVLTFRAATHSTRV